MSRREQSSVCRPYHEAVSSLKETGRVGAIVALILALGWLGSCSDDPSSPPPPPPPPAPGLIVSDPGAPFAAVSSGAPAQRIPGSSVAEEIAYVSLPSGTVPTGISATIRLVGDTTSFATALFEGGFDPVPIGAHVGDSIDVAITNNARDTVRVFGLRVNATRPPVIVRTQPSRKKKDVPLNAPIVIVFSEPIDGATLSPTGIQLLHGATAVAGTVRFLDATLGATQLIAEFVPDVPLGSGTEYQLVVTQQITDLDGNVLTAPDTVSFATGESTTGPPASISLSVSDSVLPLLIGTTFQMTATVRDAAGTMLTSHPVTWSISEPILATVSANGLVRAVAQGTARLTARVDGLSAGLWVRAVAGTLQLRTTTTGIDVPTSYRVEVARRLWPPVVVWPPGPPGPDTSFSVSVNASVAVHLVPGDYSVTIGPVPSNCDPSGYSSLPVTVATGDSATVEFAVACVPPTVLGFLTTRGEIYTMKSNLTAATRLTDGQSSNFGWSPDGGRVAFTSSRDGNSEIYVMNADGSEQTRLTNDPAADVFLSWSPDGSKIAFSSNRDGALFAYYVMNADGTNPTSVPNDPGWSRNPALSPDGTKMAVLVERTRCESGGEGWSGCVTDTDLDALSLDGSGRTQQLGWSNPDACSGFMGSGWNITCETRYADPAWAADGRLIAVNYTECDHSFNGCAYPASVRLVRADGSGRWTWLALADEWLQYAWRP